MAAKQPKLNCWEYMKCGRELNGINVKSLGNCPASTVETYNGLNNGINAGRFCWKIVGTMCVDTIRGTSAIDITSCSQCPFFELVEKEEKNSIV